MNTTKTTGTGRNGRGRKIRWDRILFIPVVLSIIVLVIGAMATNKSKATTDTPQLPNDIMVSTETETAVVPDTQAERAAKAAEAFKAQEGLVVKPSMNIHKYCNTTSEVVGYVSQGTYVVVIAKFDNMVLVEYGDEFDQLGFIAASGIEIR